MSIESEKPQSAAVYFDPIPPVLRLTEQNFDLTRDFTCHKSGAAEERWEADLREWITDRGPRGALAAIRTGDEVFLYFDEQNRLVGFGSLGVQDFIDESTGSLIGKVHLIPYAAVHTDFRGQKGPPEGRWGRRILGGLVEEVERRGQFPWLLLYVDPDNPARTRVYPLFGFVERKNIWTDPLDGRQWVLMLRGISVSAGSE